MTSTTGRARRTYDIFRYRDGVSERLTNDDDNTFWNVYVLTDGINAVYMRANT